MLDPNEILHGKKDKSKKDKGIFDMDRILPKKKGSVQETNKKEKVNPEKLVKEARKSGKNVIINNYYYQSPMKSQMPTMKIKKHRKRINLSTLNGEHFNDDDGDGYPNYMDSQPQNPEQPKKKLTYEKALQSISRNKEDK